MKFALLFLILTSLSLAQTPLAPNAPKDKPVATTPEKVAAFERAIAPHVAKAKASYPDAKKRYLAGLPPKHVFFLTTRLHDKARGAFEQVFIEVRAIDKGKVTGLIASDVMHIAGFKRGDRHTFQEKDLLDWLIAKPDGSEEGNEVGKFLDTYQP
jgi:hypothetical protein